MQFIYKLHVMFMAIWLVAWLIPFLIYQLFRPKSIITIAKVVEVTVGMILNVSVCLCVQIYSLPLNKKQKSRQEYQPKFYVQKERFRIIFLLIFPMWKILLSLTQFEQCDGTKLIGLSKRVIKFNWTWLLFVAAVVVVVVLKLLIISF